MVCCFVVALRDREDCWGEVYVAGFSDLTVGEVRGLQISRWQLASAGANLTVDGVRRLDVEGCKFQFTAGSELQW